MRAAFAIILVCSDSRVQAESGELTSEVHLGNYPCFYIHYTEAVSDFGATYQERRDHGLGSRVFLGEWRD